MLKSSTNFVFINTIVPNSSPLAPSFEGHGIFNFDRIIPNSVKFWWKGKTQNSNGIFSSNPGISARNTTLLSSFFHCVNYPVLSLSSSDYFCAIVSNNKTGKQWWQILYQNSPHCCAQKFNIHQLRQVQNVLFCILQLSRTNLVISSSNLSLRKTIICASSTQLKFFSLA